MGCLGEKWWAWANNNNILHIWPKRGVVSVGEDSRKNRHRRAPRTITKIERRNNLYKPRLYGLQRSKGHHRTLPPANSQRKYKGTPQSMQTHKRHKDNHKEEAQSSYVTRRSQRATHSYQSQRASQRNIITKSQREKT